MRADQLAGQPRDRLAWHQESKAPDIRTWYGGLVDGMRDGTGQMYMRNRYYDQVVFDALALSSSMWIS